MERCRNAVKQSIHIPLSGGGDAGLVHNGVLTRIYPADAMMDLSRTPRGFAVRVLVVGRIRINATNQRGLRLRDCRDDNRRQKQDGCHT